MKKYSVFLLTLLLCLSTALPVFADKEEWKDKTYNFQTIKTALIYDIDLTEITPGSDIKALKMQEAYKESSLRPPYKALTPELVATKIGYDHNEDLIALNTVNPEKAQKLFDQYYGNYVDVAIKATVQTFTIHTYIIPAHTDWQDRDETTTVTDDKGHTTTITRTVSYPVYVPESPGSDAIVKVRFDVYDAKTGKLILSREEERVRGGSSDPDGVYSRIVEAFYKSLKKMLDA